MHLMPDLFEVEFISSNFPEAGEHVPHESRGINGFYH
jgi:hypothetical protein